MKSKMLNNAMLGQLLLVLCLAGVSCRGGEIKQNEENVKQAISGVIHPGDPEWDCLIDQGVFTAVNVLRQVKPGMDNDANARNLMLALNESAYPVLLKGMELEEEHLAMFCIESIVQLEGAHTDAAPLLVKLMDEHERVGVSIAAQEALEKLGSAAVPMLMKSFKEKGRYVEMDILDASAPVYTLIGIGASAASAIPELIELIKNHDPVLGDRAAMILGSIGVASFPHIVELAESDCMLCKKYAAIAISAAKDPIQADKFSAGEVEQISKLLLDLGEIEDINSVVDETIFELAPTLVTILRGAGSHDIADKLEAKYEGQL